VKTYLVANLTVTDPERYALYRDQVPAIVARYGGRYLIRGGPIETVEGALALDRFVVIGFDSEDAAKRFYDSPEYAPLLKLRAETTRSYVAFVQGCEAE
jgi:uncharacterized protein (DUF1330 family)